MPTTVLYRLSSGEVLKISTRGQPFSDADATKFGVLTDPNLPDGTETRDTSGEDLGPPRQLGFAKVWDTVDVRNATQGEIDGFQAAEDDDDADLDVLDAVQLLDAHPLFRRLLFAFGKTITDEINLLRAEHALSPRTYQQVKTAVRSHISKDD
jgi:hypothetical protein